MTRTAPLLASRSGPARASRKIVDFGRDIKFSHSIFALPFALLATFLAAEQRGHLPGGAALALIVICMVLARTTAMAVNRVVDANLDAANPRTTGRALPAGRISRRWMAGVAAGCAAGFVIACAGFLLLEANPWPVILAPLALGWLCFYSYTKRFTWLCHLVLGTALALSPLAATVAVNPTFLRRPEAYLLAAMVVCWVAGFDVIYALQDVAVDRAAGLYSMPARLGVEPALWIARLLHLTAIALLLGLWRASPLLGPGFAIGVAMTATLLALEHALVWGSKTHHINVAFFTLNGVISILLGGLGIFDTVWHLIR